MASLNELMKKVKENLNDDVKFNETCEFATASQLLREGNYFFYEFEDKKIENYLNKNNHELGKYTKYISPLVYDKVINEENNRELLNIVEQKIPLYHLAPSGPVSLEGNELSSARDMGINDVPSPLQESDFYEVWFREATGYINNQLILDIYNKLQWPVLSEIQYLNASLFPSLARESYTSTSDPESLIEFRTSIEENAEDNEDDTKVGCIDYLNDIITQRLQSIYAMLDYRPSQSQILKDWGNSLYGCGVLTKDELESQYSIYKLQDLKYELLRRKFAGSKLLYSIAIASIDRQGSFIPTVPAGSFTTNTSDILFRDKRVVRIIDLPGILSSDEERDVSIKVMDTPDEEIDFKINYLSLNNIASVYYNNTGKDSNNESIKYNAEDFYTKGNTRDYFLKLKDLSVDWDAPTGISSGNFVNYIYPTLDEQIISTLVVSGLRYRTLDDYMEGDDVDVSNPTPLYLDNKVSLLSESSDTGSLFDVSMDRLLFHENSLQQILKGKYPYVTYPISGGNSISLIDSSWINYLQDITEDKSKVQDQVAFGAQVSKYQEIGPSQIAEYYFFGISYGSKEESIDNFEFGGYEEGDKYAYLWYCIVQYDPLKFYINKFTKKLISKISLKIDEETANNFPDDDCCQALHNYSMGILPFAYPNAVNNTLLGYRLGVYNKEDSSEKVFYDDLERQNYAKAFYIFSSIDIASKAITEDFELSNVSEEGSTSYPYLTVMPTKDTKAIFYVVNKGTSETDSSSNVYKWSEPINVVTLTEDFIEALSPDEKNEFYPDWYNLGYQLNPYLNFTENSASPLRHKKVLASSILDSELNTQITESALTGPSENASLCNLARSRGMDFTCNDDGRDYLPVQWVENLSPANHAAKSIRGFYLQRVAPKSVTVDSSGSIEAEVVSIYGDNRKVDAYDALLGLTAHDPSARTSIKKDDTTKIACLGFVKGEASEVKEAVANNFLRLQPYKYKDTEGSLSILNTNNWYWEGKEEGFTICVNALLDFDSSSTTSSNDLSTTMLLAKRDKEFELKVTYNDSNCEATFKVGDSDVTSKPFSLDSSLKALVRIIASYKPGVGLTIIVNGEEKSTKVRDSIDLSNSNGPIYVACDSSEEYIVNEGSEYKVYLTAVGSSNYYYWDPASKKYVSYGSSFKEDDKTIQGNILNDKGDFLDYFKGEMSTLVQDTEVNTPYIFKLKVLNGESEIIRYFNYETSSTKIDDKINYNNFEEKTLAYGSIDTSIKYKQKDCFFGSLYDLRLYKKGYSGPYLQLLERGTLRELFSYSPSIYTLGYNVYNDIGVFKELSSRESSNNEIENIKSIRVFNRSIWDSIIPDVYPISVEEATNTSSQYREDHLNPKDDVDVYGWVNGIYTFNDCIEQVLQDAAEVNNNVVLNKTTTFKYRNNPIEVTSQDYITVVNSCIYPVSYERNAYTSIGSHFQYNLSSNTIFTEEDQGIKLPSALDTTDGVLSYEADLNLNFTISPITNFTNWYSHGDHISLSYDNVLQKVVAQNSIAGSSTSQNNHILFPMTLPRQIDLSYNNVGYLDRFILNGVVLNSNLITLLKAESYYNELRIPVAFSYVQNGSFVTTYASKWDALRTLKEGTYYITCKYPFQIIPFDDSLYSINSEAKYNYLYATVRFKIEVSGIPLTYQLGNNGADDITTSNPEKYSASRIKTTLASEDALLHPANNRTFPHRAINIDLYVQDCVESTRQFAGQMLGDEENYSYSWKLLGTNHPEDFKASSSFIYLTQDRLKDSLVITEDIPLFFSKNYTSPFFIAGTKRSEDSVVYKDPASADDDLIDPIKIAPLYNFTKIANYVPATGYSISGISYYTYQNNSFEIANPQPEANIDLDTSTTKYYTKVEGLDRLEVSREEDLDNLVLAAGRSYKILWDYTGYVSEFSYVDEAYSQNSGAQKELITNTKPKYEMGDDEKINYSRLSNLLDNSNPSEYKYTQSGLEYSFTSRDLSGKTCGYDVDMNYYKQVEISTVLEDFSDDYAEENAHVTLTQYGERGCKSYIEYGTIELSADPLVAEDGILYHIVNSDDSDEDTWKVKTSRDTNSLVNTSDFDILDISDWSSWDFGKFYKEPNTGKYYRAIISLDSVVFEDTTEQKYYIWDNVYPLLSEITLSNVTTYEDLPYPGDSDILYRITDSSVFYRYLGKSVESFTEIFNNKNTSSPFYFGNPYSKSSEKNFLLQVRDVSKLSSRENIINSGYFPYVPTEVPENMYLSGVPITSTLEAIKSSYRDTSYVAFNESSIIMTQHSRMLEKVDQAISSLISGNTNTSQSNHSGIFTALSEIKPRITYTNVIDQTTTVVAENSYVRKTTDQLCAYYASERNLPSKNGNIEITRRGLYSNNLLTNQDFDNSSAWKWEDYSTLPTLPRNLFERNFVSDLDWGNGKDVCEVVYSGLISNDSAISAGTSNVNNPITMKYISGSTKMSASYEIALNVKVVGEEKYYYFNESLTPIPSSNISILDSTIERASDLPETGNTSVVYLSKIRGKVWRWNSTESRYVEGKIKYYDPTLASYDSDTLYVDSPARKLTTYVYFLSNNNIVDSLKKLNVRRLSQGSANLDSKIMFANVWYNLSYESDLVEADTIAFAYACTENLTFRITKAIVRKSESRVHTLGLSDGLYTRSSSNNDASVYMTSHKCVAYRNKITKEILPIQFNASVHNRPSSSNYNASSITFAVSGLDQVQDFINNYKISNSSSNNKIEELFDPWVRRMYYKREESSDIINIAVKEADGNITFYSAGDDNLPTSTPLTVKEGSIYYLVNGDHNKLYKATYDRTSKKATYTSEPMSNGLYYIGKSFTTGDEEEITYIGLDYLIEGPLVERVYFTKYISHSDSFGIKSFEEVALPISDIYSDASINIGDILNIDSDNYTRYLKVNHISLDTTTSSPLNKYDTNLQITSENLSNIDEYIIANGPITLSDEKVSALSNCFNPKKYRLKDGESEVAITNVQLLSPTDLEGNKRILFEIEYPPIVYDESSQHISFNIMLKKSKTSLYQN